MEREIFNNKFLSVQCVRSFKDAFRMSYAVQVVLSNSFSGFNEREERVESKYRAWYGNKYNIK